MIYYAAIDTNVLVSALLSKHSDSATVLVVDRIFDGAIIALYSNEILDEYREVLKRPKFKFDTHVVDVLIAAVERNGISVEPREMGAILADMKDLPFYEVVMDKRNYGAYLVTGNIKHFPKEPFIVTPKELLDIISR